MTHIDAQNGKHYIENITAAKLVAPLFTLTTNTFPKMTSTYP